MVWENDGRDICIFIYNIKIIFDTLPDEVTVQVIT